VVLCCRKLAPGRELHAEQMEKPGRHAISRQPFGYTWRSQIHVMPADADHLLERLFPSLPVLKVEAGYGRARGLRIILEHYNQSVWLEIWKRCHNHSVENTEHCSVDAYAKRKRQHSHDREAWIPAHHSQPVACV
jgi:hypothetical protein